MFQKLAFRLVNKRLIVTASVLGAALLLFAAFTQSWRVAAPAFLLVGLGGGMLLQGIEQRNRDQESYDDAYPPTGGRVVDN